MEHENLRLVSAETTPRQKYLDSKLLTRHLHYPGSFRWLPH